MGFVYWKKSICLFASLVLACAIVIWSTAHAQTDSANDKLLRADADIKKITQRLEPLLPTLMKDECVPGMTIGLIDNGELVWVRGFGVRDLRSNERVTKKTVFEAASLGKPAFSYAVLRMSERGEINIDKPLYEYLRRDYVENDSRIRLITARMVLSHTSGFRVFGRQILFQPGEKFLYSTAAYAYLQRVIEHITGLPLNEIMERELFSPLGMSSSSYIWRDAYEAQIAVGHDWDGRPCQKRKWAKGCAAYTLYTTVQDYARFICAILNATRLEQHTQNEMLSTQIVVPINKENPTSEKHPLLSWGLGVGLQNTKVGPAFWHWGDNDIFKSYFVAYTDLKTGVLYFTNSQYGLSMLAFILKAALGGHDPTIDWLGYSEHYSSSYIIRLKRRIFYKLKKKYWNLYRRLQDF